jgi:hypothetical protein
MFCIVPFCIYCPTEFLTTFTLDATELATLATGCVILLFFTALTLLTNELLPFLTLLIRSVELTTFTPPISKPPNKTSPNVESATCFNFLSAKESSGSIAKADT